MLIDVDKRWELSCIENRLAPFGGGLVRRDLLNISLSLEGVDNALFKDFPFIRLNSSRLAKSRCAVSLKRLNAASPNSSTNLAFTSL